MTKNLRELYWQLIPILLQSVRQHIGRRHLDFGCGKGLITSWLASRHPSTEIIAYDPNRTDIEFARNSWRVNNVKYTHEAPEVGEGFDSASLTFVLHEMGAEQALSEVLPKMLPEGRLILVDYDIKGVPKDQFARMFILDSEREELQKIGMESAYKMHTRAGLEDYAQSAQAAGFQETAKTKLFDKYFIWVGKKVA